MKKVLLIHPEISRTKYNFAGVIDNEPLELEYICTLLNEKNIPWKIWDGQVETIPAADAIKEFSPDFVYVCGRTRQESFMLEYCRAAKEICGSITAVGGLHAQHNYMRFFSEYVDYVFTSFDIFGIIEIICGSDPESIDGICFRSGGEQRINPPKPFDINRLPLPDRSQFYEHSDRYRYLELSPCAHVRTAYCCPFKCKFCSRNRLNCGVYSCRDIESVVDEIADIKCDNIYFIDDDFLIDKHRIMRFISLIKERNIRKKYVCYGRADFIAENPDIIRELKEIGFYYILAGLESADDTHLESYNKMTDINANEKAVQITNSVGINLMGMFIVDPDFTAKNFRDIYRWITSHKLLHTAVSVFTPELNSPLFEQYRDRIISDDPAEWDYLHVVVKPAHMSVSAYYFHYHMLVLRLFIRGYKDGIYDFVDYGYYIRSIIKNMFKFGG